MERHEKNLRRLLGRSFGRFLDVPQAPVDPAWERVLERLREEPEGASASARVALDSVRPIPSVWMARELWVAAAAVLVLTVTLSVAFWPARTPAVVESVEGGLLRVLDGKTQPLEIRDSIEMGDVIRSNGGSGGTIMLADGSRIEMRTKSELWLERAGDGLRIQLRNGGIIVNAAKQRTGHLYVQTKDVTVTVVGTVFLVNAEEEGSRVAVIEGEVHVQQGAMETKLRPGEQVRSNPKMESLSVGEEVAWSRQAVAHVAMLQQANPREGRLAFELATIRPAAPPPPTGPTTRGGAPDRYFGCNVKNLMQLDPRRLSMRDQTLVELVAWAYGSCDELVNFMMPFERVSGGLDWFKSDGWDIEALIPEGSVDPLPTTAFGGPITELAHNRSPRVQEMLRTLLEDRFKVVLRRETKEMPVYVLTVAPGGPKFQGKDQIVGFWLKGPGMIPAGVDARDTPGRGATVAEGAQLSVRNDRSSCLGADGRPGPRGRGGPVCTSAIFGNLFMDEVASHLSETQFAGRPVFNRTSIQERVTFRFDLPEVPFVPGRPPQPFSFQDLAKGLATVGLELKEDPKGLVEFFVIARAEKPSEN